MSDPTREALWRVIADAIDTTPVADAATYVAGHPASDAMVNRVLDAVLAALSTTPAPPDYGWHGDGDLCLGPECLNIDENTGDHDTDVHSDEWWDGFTEAGRRIAPVPPSKEAPHE